MFDTLIRYRINSFLKRAAVEQPFLFCFFSAQHYTNVFMEQPLQNSVGIVQTQKVRIVDEANPLELVCKKKLAPIDVAYETYGQLNEQADNAVLICHALSGNAHVAGYNSPEDKKPGWWEDMVGPAKAIDTDKYFVICSNFLGGCSGTTGPSDTNPATGKPYGLDFPQITIKDMVNVQKLLLDKLGIKKLLSVIGGSMGGMQVLQWAICYPEMVNSAIVIASTSRLGAQSIAFDAVGRNAILEDPNFNKGRYHSCEKGPANGLAIARMIGHITYLSEESMRKKFGRELRNSKNYRYDMNSEFSVETYLEHQGQRFVERFDANSYLYITKAMDYFDLSAEFGSLQNAFKNTKSRFLITSYSSDWLFTPAQSEETVNALIALGKDVSYCNIDSPYGHDAFLLEPVIQTKLIAGFLKATLTLSRGKTPQDLLPAEPKDKISPAAAVGPHRLRVDYELIESLIEPDSRVLDVGCGDGLLLANLEADKNVDGEGIEFDQDFVAECIGKGIGIIHRNIERGLENYASGSFDYAILSQTLQTLKDPQKAFSELLRVAKRVIVSFPNFAYFKCRYDLFFKGKAPKSKQLPYQWYDSPNIHFLSLRDFEKFCSANSILIEKKIALSKSRAVKFAPNFFADQAIYLTSQK